MSDVDVSALMFPRFTRSADLEWVVPHRGSPFVGLKLWVMSSVADADAVRLSTGFPLKPWVAPSKSVSS